MNTTCHVEIHMTGYGVVRDPRVDEFHVFILQIHTDRDTCWTIYRRPDSFYILSQQLEGFAPPCPEVDDHDDEKGLCHPGRHHHLLVWLQHLLTLPQVVQSQNLQDFLSIEANFPPPGLELETSSNALPSVKCSSSRGSPGGRTCSSPSSPSLSLEDYHHVALSSHPLENVDEMNMEDMFDHQPPVSPHQHDEEEEEDHHHHESMALEEEKSHHQRMLSSSRTSLLPNTCRSSPNSKNDKVSLDDFQLLKVIGKGSFGKVLQVRKVDTGRIYAMKVLRKENIIKRNQVEHTRTERQVLGYVHHPFVVSLQYAFQTSDKLYFILDYCAGGELFFHLGKVSRFHVQRARFYIAEITLALEYMHSLDIIYRDLKPENVLLDEAGHIKLTDFGLSKEGIHNNFEGAHSFCGTPEYLAPEILNRSGHGRAVDWWSLGALLFEMLVGLPPFFSRDREQLFYKIRYSDLVYPKFLSLEAKSLLRGLLERDPTRRLGTGPSDALDIKSHPFFNGIDWHALYCQHTPPPWVPSFTGSLDTSQFDFEFTSMPVISPRHHTARSNMTTRTTACPDDECRVVAAHPLFPGFTFTQDSVLVGERPQRRKARQVHE